MASYCVSDIHGEYQKFLQLLEKLRFSANDTLYVIGDMVDRGPQPLTLVRDIMRRENVIALAGNHEMMAAVCLRPMINGGWDGGLDDRTMEAILLWHSDGGGSTLKEFKALSVDERRETLEWLADLELYRELTIGGNTFVLAHAGFGKGFSPDRPLDDYDVEDYLFSRTDYGRVYFPDKFLVTGHTPTILIPQNEGQCRIYRACRHIAIDCGCTFGGRLAAFCLETGEEIYV